MFGIFRRSSRVVRDVAFHEQQIIGQKLIKEYGCRIKIYKNSTMTTGIASDGCIVEVFRSSLQNNTKFQHLVKRYKGVCDILNADFKIHYFNEDIKAEIDIIANMNWMS